jgi:hypothetical protein
MINALKGFAGQVASAMPEWPKVSGFPDWWAAGHAWRRGSKPSKHCWFDLEICLFPYDVDGGFKCICQ